MIPLRMSTCYLLNGMQLAAKSTSYQTSSVVAAEKGKGDTTNVSSNCTQTKCKPGNQGTHVLKHGFFGVRLLPPKKSVITGFLDGQRKTNQPKQICKKTVLSTSPQKRCRLPHPLWARHGSPNPPSPPPKPSLPPPKIPAHPLSRRVELPAAAAAPADPSRTPAAAERPPSAAAAAPPPPEIFSPSDRLTDARGGCRKMEFRPPAAGW